TQQCGRERGNSEEYFYSDLWSVLIRQAEIQVARWLPDSNCIKHNFPSVCFIA
ncbi:hypothetical protein J6590_082829, partial [Homalodisca vitripennis]